jgi:hypothetical protein
MIPTNLYAELQSNPTNVVAYRKLAEYYLKAGRKNESEAFLFLIEKRFRANGTDSDQEQRADNRSDS